ncbi:MAG TPA: ATP-binding protein [Vicinamibacterales bacterium]|nr:ATP-binding protein [Vicinamibacterales bacterium]
MQLSLRTRLTVWYSLLLVLTVAVFSTAVLWLHWRLLLEQLDDSLRAISATANNVVEEELEDREDLPHAASDVAEVVRSGDGAVEILDAAGVPVRSNARRMLPLPAEVRSPGFTRATRTLSSANGRPWRVSVRGRSSHGTKYFVAVGAPLDEAIEQWETLLKACLIGIPLALLFAAGGGWWLGRHGLRPLTGMAAEAQAITAQTLDSRLTVPPSTTELTQLAGSFNRVLDRLGSALSTQRRFMADASHEIRTPVSIMRTAADVTLSQPSRDEGEYREALVAIAQQTTRLTRLVDDMLVLARADGGGYPMVMTSVDLAAVVNECVRELGARAEDKGITVHTSLEPLTLTGDEALLRRMLSNLVGNALAYTAQGGSVDISLAKTDGRLMLSVADTGPGIPPEDRERVFERFVRLDPARAAGGAGLGLAIARWVAEAHGGTVRVVSSGSAGTVFAASLPV